MIDAMQKIEQLLGACFRGLRLALHALVARRKLLYQVGAVAGGTMLAYGYPWIHNILFREHNSATNIIQTSSSAWARTKREAMFVLGNPGKMADSTEFMTNYRGISAKLKKYASNALEISLDYVSKYFLEGDLCGGRTHQKHPSSSRVWPQA